MRKSVPPMPPPCGADDWPDADHAFSMGSRGARQIHNGCGTSTIAPTNFANNRAHPVPRARANRVPKIQPHQTAPLPWSPPRHAWHRAAHAAQEASSPRHCHHNQASRHMKKTRPRPCQAPRRPSTNAMPSTAPDAPPPHAASAQHRRLHCS